MLATAFVVALASGAAGPLDVGWASPTGEASTAAVKDVGWSTVAGGSGDVGWGVTLGASDDVGWSTPADADA
ncbi:5'-nucleotidase [Streptomyces sp. NPDC058676]|uniref:5'-nucleotidase n=1 Tax=unclassified Streptomyces TaxID=2593676 RepID=UPI003656599F